MRFLTTFVFFTVFSFAFSQEIVVVDQNGEKLEKQSFFVEIVIDNDSTITFNTDRFNVSRDFCDDLAEINIAGDFVQTYVNQYLPNQFKLLDTIRVYQSRYIAHTSPILLIDITQEIDSILQYDLGFSSTLKQIGLPYTLSFKVFNTNRITKKEKKFIEKVKKTYCDYLGIDDETIKLIYEDKAYISVQQDFFSRGTIITRDFINSQNTSWMKGQAEKYKLVMWLMINWEK
ncbi:MAG: hypothetical protein ACK5B9_14335 [Flavobacteriia bacterium]